ncbi:MAG: flavodoxin family protein [Candidatus Promineifilaceae bacterium]|jgi:flavodoxin
MNTLVVHFSKFGHTERLALEIAAALGPPVTVISAEEFSSEALEGKDLLIIGTPTHKMNLPEVVKPVLDRLPKGAMRGKQFAAFDTSYELSRPLQPFTAAKRLDRKLRKLGGTRILAPETFIVEGREGPLRDGEQQRAQKWAATIALTTQLAVS